MSSQFVNAEVTNISIDVNNYKQGVCLHFDHKHVSLAVKPLLLLPTPIFISPSSLTAFLEYIVTSLVATSWLGRLLTMLPVWLTLISLPFATKIDSTNFPPVTSQTIFNMESIFWSLYVAVLLHIVRPDNETIFQLQINPLCLEDQRLAKFVVLQNY